MRRVNPSIYNKGYYLKSCLGHEEFRKYKGKKVNKRISDFLDLINIKENIKILDLGCGRGDMAMESARRGAYVFAVDYSKDGIEIAKEALSFPSETVKRRVNFSVMDAKNLKFKDNFFDIILSFDVFEHLYKEELSIAMREISRILKPGGMLLVHTEANKIYLDYTHSLWVYPLDSFLIKINKILFGIDYPGFDKDPRNDLHKIQHVNEPTYSYLKELFNENHFVGNIKSIIPYKPVLGWRDIIYNFIVWLYPFSNFPIINQLFAYDYICLMTNKKNK